MLVSPDFLTTTHGKQKCTACHGGVASARSRSEAHKGMKAKPDENVAVCKTCHTKSVDMFQKNLHWTTAGITNLDTGILAARVNPATKDALQGPVNTHCASCHTTTCGDCHVSRPQSSGGGLVNGHNFYSVPNSVLNCTACHGSRIEREFMGKAPEEATVALKPDVHWTPGGLQCSACHTEDELHGTATPPKTRYETPARPSCVSCHLNSDKFAKVEQHRMHAQTSASSGSSSGLPTLQCQVCHSQSYNTCYGCHVGKDSKGLAFYKVDKSEFNFKIGRNPNKTADAPWDYVVVRHVPVARDTFAYYGKDFLTGFDNQATWKKATPHNILLDTAQNKSCDSCHTNADLFLKASDVLPDEQKANAGVVVPALPPRLGR